MICMDGDLRYKSHMIFCSQNNEADENELPVLGGVTEAVRYEHAEASESNLKDDELKVG